MTSLNSRFSRSVYPAGAALAMLGLAGCRVGPDYQQRQAKAPDAYSSLTDPDASLGVKPVAGAADPAALAAWWGVFGDTTLDSLVSRAVEGNLDLRLARARVREARALRGVADSTVLPTVDASGGVTRSQRSGTVRNSFGSDDATTLWDVGLDASWEIDVFGGKRRGIEAAQGDLEAAVEDQRAVLVTLAAEVARNYNELRGFQRRIVVTEQTIRAAQETLELTESRSRAGLSAEIETEQSRAQLATRQSQLPSLRSAAHAAAFRLSVLLGQSPGALLAELDQAGTIPKPPAEIPVGLPSELLTRRPDVRRAERQLAAATARIGVEESELYPKFTLTGALGLQSGELASLPDTSSRAWSIGPTVRWRLFDRRAIHQRIAAADARAEQALIAYDQTMLTSLEEVENALTGLVEEQARWKRLDEAVTASRRAVNLANERYRSGIGDFLTVLVNQRELYDREDQLVQSEASVTRNVIALYKALGGGWAQADPAVSQPTEPLPK
ncbi:Outer membrane protein OprM [Phycisphaerales bacterium]|nr:Outer membrane protein OprM [Phycisphaerales bacterium]